MLAGLMGAVFCTKAVAGPVVSAAPSGLRKAGELVVFGGAGGLSASFIERGASQFATVSPSGLVWAPASTNLYTLILARRGEPRVVTGKTVGVEFRLLGDGTSLGLHVHGSSESAPSHVVLIGRTAADRGLLRVYRTPTWPSGSITAAEQLPSALARVPAFPADTWYRLVVTTPGERTTAGAMLFVQLLDAADSTPLASLEVADAGPALPSAGQVALRLFASAGGRIEVRALVGEPQP